MDDWDDQPEYEPDYGDYGGAGDYAADSALAEIVASFQPLLNSWVFWAIVIGAFAFYQWDKSKREDALRAVGAAEVTRLQGVIVALDRQIERSRNQEDVAVLEYLRVEAEQKLGAAQAQARTGRQFDATDRQRGPDASDMGGDDGE